MAYRHAFRILPVLLGSLALLLALPAHAEFRYVEATIADVHQAIRSGEKSCVDIVNGYLARIEAYDKPSGMNAIIFNNPAKSTYRTWPLG